MVKEAERETKEEELSLKKMKRRLDNLDQRLDNIDSMLTAIAERTMNRPISITVTCHNCGQIIEVGVVGSEKPMM